MLAMNGGLLLAIDAGGSMVKATVFYPAGGRSRTVSQSIPVARHLPGQSERDPDVLWAATAGCIRKVLAGIRRGAERISAIGLTAHGNGLYLVDADGRATRAAVMAADTRAASLVRRWAADGLADHLQARSWNGLWAGQPGPILASLAHTEPDVLAGSHAALSCKDYLWGRLTGSIETELTAASASALYDNAAWAADPGGKTLEVNDEMIEAFGLTRWRCLLGIPVSPTTVRFVSPMAADVTGLLPGTPIVAGVVDNAAMHHGSGVFDSNTICVGTGTWSINQILVPTSEVETAVAAIRPNAANIALNGMALLCEASPTSASNLDWALNQAIRTTATEHRTSGLNIYTERLNLDECRRQSLDDPVFLPFIDGSRADSGARGAWVGLSSATGEDQLLGAVIEGICFEHRRHVDRLQAALPTRQPVRLSGGATKSAVWCQRFADALGVPVHASPVTELGSVCAGAMAGVSAGTFADVVDGVLTLNPTWDVYQPNPLTSDFVTARYARYCDLAAYFDHMPWEA